MAVRRQKTLTGGYWTRTKTTYKLGEVSVYDMLFDLHRFFPDVTGYDDSK